jgi:hypothetical protein
MRRIGRAIDSVVNLSDKIFVARKNPLFLAVLSMLRRS